MNIIKKNKKIPQAISSLAEWISYIKKIHSHSIELGLDRVKTVAMRLDVLNPAPFIFSVTGTNGKGTTCCTLESILIASGYKVGVYSSPHLLRYTERVRIQNAELSESVHADSFSIIEYVRGNIPLTYFEYSTISALWLFKRAKIDIAILEVGLGGRLDATNIVDSDVSILTNIGIDHTNWLGSDRESIAFEKSGIFRTGKPAVIGDLDIPNIIIQVAKKNNIKLLRRNIDWSFILENNYWTYTDKLGELRNLPFPNIPKQNAASAIAALRYSKLKVQEEAIYKGIRNAKLPGRFQVIRQSPKLILDVAHNPHAAKYLADRLKSVLKNGRVLAVVGMLHDKDIATTLSVMETVVNKWYCATIKGFRGAKAERLTKYLYKKSQSYEDVEKAWMSAMSESYPEDVVIVFGSFQTVASVMKSIHKEIINNK